MTDTEINEYLSKITGLQLIQILRTHCFRDQDFLNEAVALCKWEAVDNIIRFHKAIDIVDKAIGPVLEIALLEAKETGNIDDL